MWVYLHPLSRCFLPNMPTSAKFREDLNLQQFKVIQGRWLWYHGKRICDFLLLINKKNLSYRAQFLRYGDLLAENCIFFVFLFHLAPPFPMFPLEFRSEVNCEETRVIWLLCGKSCVMLTSTVFDSSTRVTDGRTNRRTVRQTDETDGR